MIRKIIIITKQHKNNNNNNNNNNKATKKTSQSKDTVLSFLSASLLNPEHVNLFFISFYNEQLTVGYGIRVV